MADDADGEDTGGYEEKVKIVDINMFIVFGYQDHSLQFIF
jgi:hypothetical protein